MQACHHIGTSGWQYAHWRDVFYPHGLTARSCLQFYAGRFGTVEINNSFYRLPKAETFAHWGTQVPADFLFAVKANRFITHLKKLRDPAQPIGKMLDAAESLGPRLGPILFQLPPRWKKNTGRLGEFLKALPRIHRYAFEFRDEDWFGDDVYGLLRDHGAALCMYELDRRRSPMEVTAEFVYIRLHGPGGPYQGSYDDAALREWAELIVKWRGDGKDVYCYFDNDQYGYAPMNAGTLVRMIDETRG